MILTALDACNWGLRPEIAQCILPVRKVVERTLQLAILAKQRENDLFPVGIIGRGGQ